MNNDKRFIQTFKQTSSVFTYLTYNLIKKQLDFKQAEDKLLKICFFYLDFKAI